MLTREFRNVSLSQFAIDKPRKPNSVQKIQILRTRVLIWSQNRDPPTQQDTQQRASIFPQPICIEASAREQGAANYAPPFTRQRNIFCLRPGTHRVDELSDVVRDLVVALAPVHGRAARLQVFPRHIHAGTPDVQQEVGQQLDPFSYISRVASKPCKGGRRRGCRGPANLEQMHSHWHNNRVRMHRRSRQPARTVRSQFTQSLAISFNKLDPEHNKHCFPYALASRQLDSHQLPSNRSTP